MKSKASQKAPKHTKAGRVKADGTPTFRGWIRVDGKLHYGPSTTAEKAAAWAAQMRTMLAFEAENPGSVTWPWEPAEERRGFAAEQEGTIYPYDDGRPRELVAWEPKPGEGQNHPRFHSEGKLFTFSWLMDEGDYEEQEREDAAEERAANKGKRRLEIFAEKLVAWGKQEGRKLLRDTTPKDIPLDAACSFVTWYAFTHKTARARKTKSMGSLRFREERYARICEWFDADKQRARFPKGKATPLQEITVEAWQDFVDWREESGASGNAIEKDKACLSGMFTLLYKHAAWNGSNPVQRIDWPEVQATKKGTLKLKQITQTLEEMEVSDDRNASRDHAILSLALLAYLRRGELCGIEIQDVDREEKTLTIRNEVAKNGLERKVGLSRDAFRAIDTLAGNRTKGKLVPLTEDGVSQAMASWGRFMGLPGLCIKDVRHVAIDQLKRSGVDPVTLSKTTGHSPTTGAKWYHDVHPKDRAKIALAAAKLLR